jgi:hypothetical protein
MTVMQVQYYATCKIKAATSAHEIWRVSEPTSLPAKDSQCRMELFSRLLDILIVQ